MEEKEIIKGGMEVYEVGLAIVNKLWVFLSAYFIYYKQRTDKERDESEKRINELEKKVDSNESERKQLAVKIDGLTELFNSKFTHIESQNSDLKDMIRDLQISMQTNNNRVN